MMEHTVVGAWWVTRLALVGLAFAATLALTGEAAAQSAALKQGQEPVAPVFTRARLVFVSQEAGGKRYVRLKLLPRAKIPFTTQVFQVADPALLAGISEGAWVRFTARHMDGENTLTAIHVVEECPRFQQCE